MLFVGKFYYIASLWIFESIFNNSKAVVLHNAWQVGRNNRERHITSQLVSLSILTGTRKYWSTVTIWEFQWAGNFPRCRNLSQTKKPKRRMDTQDLKIRTFIRCISIYVKILCIIVVYNIYKYDICLIVGCNWWMCAGSLLYAVWDARKGKWIWI